MDYIKEMYKKEMANGGIVVMAYGVDYIFWLEHKLDELLGKKIEEATNETKTS